LFTVTLSALPLPKGIVITTVRSSYIVGIFIRHDERHVVSACFYHVSNERMTKAVARKPVSRLSRSASTYTLLSRAVYVLINALQALAYSWSLFRRLAIWRRTQDLSRIVLKLELEKFKLTQRKIRSVRNFEMKLCSDNGRESFQQT